MDVTGGQGVSRGQFLQLTFLGACAVRGQTWREIIGFLVMYGIRVRRFEITPMGLGFFLGVFGAVGRGHNSVCLLRMASLAAKPKVAG